MVSHITEALKVHGKRQFEVKQKVSFAPGARELRYQVETYFFLPTALQVNSDTYSSQEFQRCLKNYVRLRPPTCGLRYLCNDDNAIGKLRLHLYRFGQQPEARLQDYEATLKLFALTYKRALRLAVKALQIKGSSAQQALDVLADMANALRAYRELAPLTQPLEVQLCSNAFAYCDEYISVISTYYLREMNSKTEMRLSTQIGQAWRQEMEYRKAHYPDSVSERGSSNELPLYRWSILKKYVSRCLYLDVRRKKGEPFLLHSLYGFAAALSMFFATVIAFMWQDKYGALSINLFLALVVGYIFKDRIKEVARQQLFIMFRKWIPDRRLLIYFNDKTEVGACNETFRFVAEHFLSPQIRQMRQQSHWINILNDSRPEDVLLYKKDVVLRVHPEMFADKQFSIVDITRFNIGDFLKYIDNMFEELPIIESEEEKPGYGEKTYHIYVIRKINFGDQAIHELVRLVINANGIKKMEFLPNTVPT